MRIITNHIEGNRIVRGPLASRALEGMNGAFLFGSPIDGAAICVIVSDQDGWEHVSVSRKNRCPNWPEMCFIKEKFWNDDETVIQYHPAKENYVNKHKYCLHMWKLIGLAFPLPPNIFV